MLSKSLARNIEYSFLIKVSLSNCNSIFSPEDYQREISEVFIHDQFEVEHKNSSYYDVAVLVLDEPIVYSDEEKHQVRPICLPKVKNWNKKKFDVRSFPHLFKNQNLGSSTLSHQLIFEFKSPGNYIF